MIFNVMDFGATGDGVTNDTAAIQAAVNAAAAAGGGQVYIPAGTYIVSGDGTSSHGCILLSSNVSVIGAGMGNTIIQLQDGSDHGITGIFRDHSDVPEHDISMSDLTINGNDANTTGEVYGWFNGVTPEKNAVLDPNEPADTNITLDHVEIENCSGYGFDPHEKTVGLVISNSVSHNNGTDGFTLDGQYNATLTNDIAYDNGRHGFNIVTSSNNVTLNNVTAYGNGEDGVMVQRGSNDVPVPFNVVINGGSFHNNDENAVEIKMADNVTVDGANIFDNGQRAVRIEGSAGSIIENSTIYDDTRAGNGKYQEISISSVDDSSGVSGRVYTTTGTQIINNTISDDGAIRASYSVQEFADGTNNTTVANNVIYGTGEDHPLLVGSNSAFTAPPLMAGTADPNAPTILYAPLLGQSNAELMKITAPDGSSGLGQFYNGFQQLGYSQVVTMTNIAVGGSSVNGDSNSHPPPWWYLSTGQPGPSLLAAVEQMQQQVSELGQNAHVTPIVIWAQGEAEGLDIGKKTSALARNTAEAQYITETLGVFDYIKSHVDPNTQFYIMETGRFNQVGATNLGYTQKQIDQVNLGLSYVDDGQIKMALADSSIHLAVNYSDLPMNADVPSSTPGYQASWANDPWHLAPTSKEIAANRATGFIALNAGVTHILENPGPYPIAALADLNISGGTNLNINHAGAGNSAIITDGTGRGNHLTGGDGNDTFVIGGLRDIITSGSGSDTIYFSRQELQQVQTVQSGAVNDIHNTLNNFKTGAGGDVIDVSAMLMADGYTGKNAVGDGYVQLVDSSLGLSVRFDPDGSAGKQKAVTIALLSGIHGDFDVANNLVTQFPGGNPIAINSNTHVASVVLPPIAKTDIFADQQNQPLTGNLLSDNGNGPDTDPNGLALSVVAKTLTTAHGATVTENANGTFTYTPATGFTGNDSFTYTLADSAGMTATGTANVTVSEGTSYTIPQPVIQALNGVTPAATLVTSVSNTTIDGIHGSYNNVIVASGSKDLIMGHDGNDVLIGGSGGDTLNSYFGNDVLYGSQGSNNLNGGPGNDTLISCSGANSMSGGTGNDVFVFSEAKVLNVYDIITDFDISADKLNINALLGSNGTAQLQAVSGGTGLYVDQDGSGHSALIAIFQGTSNVMASTDLHSILV